MTEHNHPLFWQPTMTPHEMEGAKFMIEEFRTGGHSQTFGEYEDSYGVCAMGLFQEFAWDHLIISQQEHEETHEGTLAPHEHEFEITSKGVEGLLYGVNQLSYMNPDWQEVERQTRRTLLHKLKGNGYKVQLTSAGHDAIVTLNDTYRQSFESFADYLEADLEKVHLIPDTEHIRRVMEEFNLIPNSTPELPPVSASSLEEQIKEAQTEHITH